VNFHAESLYPEGVLPEVKMVPESVTWVKDGPDGRGGFGWHTCLIGVDGESRDVISTVTYW